MSIFGQVWLWSLLAFFVGAFLAWLVLVLPARKRIRELESSLATSHAETSRVPTGVTVGAGAAATATGTAYLAKPSHRDDELDEEFAAAEEEPTPAYPETLAEHQPAQSRPAPVEETPVPAKDVVGKTPEPAPKPEPEVDVPPVPEPAAAEAMRYTPAARIEPEPAPKTAPENPYVSAATEYLQPASKLDIEAEPEPLPGEGAYRSRLEIQLDPEGAKAQPAPASLFQPEPREETAAPNWFEKKETPEPSAYAFGADEDAKVGVLDSEPEPPAEAAQVLPKRTPRETARGGFEPAQAIQPSMRAIERREPDVSRGRGGSLFEPTVQPGGSMPAPEPPPARQVPPSEEVPPGPFGPGSAMPRPGGGRPADDFTVKASVTALRYCTEDSAQFPKMVAEVWFRSATDAERVGFRPLS